MLEIMRRIISRGARFYSACWSWRPSCCSAGVCCMPGDIPNVLNWRYIGGFGWTRQCSYVSESRRHERVRCGRALWGGGRHGTRSFHQCAGQMEQPLDVNFDQRNVDRSSYLLRPIIPSFGCTWYSPRPWYCHPTTYRAAGLFFSLTLHPRHCRPICIDIH